VPDAENRDLRQLLWHRHRLLQMHTRVMNQLHVIPLNEGLRRRCFINMRAISHRL
jgi:transposase